MEWTHLTSDGVEAWIASIQKMSPPRHYPFVGQPAARNRLEGLRVGNVPDSRVIVRDDSGTLEVDLRLRDAIAGAVFPGLVDLARRVDERTYVSAIGTGAPAAPRIQGREAEWHSRIDDVDVVGPGGRVVVYRTTRGLWADITVRHRDVSRGSTFPWRSPSEIAERMRQRVEGWPPTAGILGAFGYFEASKYESQDWLRPVFLLVLNEPREPGVPRRAVGVTEEATIVS